MVRVCYSDLDLENPFIVAKCSFYFDKYTRWDQKRESNNGMATALVKRVSISAREVTNSLERHIPSETTASLCVSEWESSNVNLWQESMRHL